MDKVNQPTRRDKLSVHPALALALAQDLALAQALWLWLRLWLWPRLWQGIYNRLFAEGLSKN